MASKELLEKSEKELPELDEFHKKYCETCGSQQCYGVYDELCREGCKIWRDKHPVK